MKTTIEYGEELEKILYGEDKVFSYLKVKGNKAIIMWADDVLRKDEIETIDNFCDKNGLDWQLLSECIGDVYPISNINIEIWIKNKKRELKR